MMKETEVNTNFAQIVNYHIRKFVMIYISFNYFSDIKIFACITNHDEFC